MTGNRKLVIGGEVIFTPKRRPPDVERWLIEGEPMSESESAFIAASATALWPSALALADPKQRIQKGHKRQAACEKGPAYATAGPQCEDNAFCGFPLPEPVTLSLVVLSELAGASPA
jgi:hypothetical protein